MCECFNVIVSFRADTDNQVASYTVGNNLLEWREVDGGQLPSPRAGLRASMVGNSIFVTGGLHGDTFLTSILSWDPTNESWQAAGNLSVARFQHAAVAVSLPTIASECLARPDCRENQYGMDGCEPEPFLCRLFLCSILLLVSTWCQTFLFRVICKKDDECQLEESDPQTPTCTNANITLPDDYESFAADICQQDCAKSDLEKDDSKRCRFWRFVSIMPSIIQSRTDFLSEGLCGHCEDLFPDDVQPMHSV